ncbi:hypothetical protein ACIGXA_01095 [Streptomyces fildesensis]|uniref:Secreted protein n=1 Tax=Streptomyces fildesensis TaxID=375757 RepID=A0ABW8BZV4_9ACTN
MLLVLCLAQLQGKQAVQAVLLVQAEQVFAGAASPLRRESSSSPRSPARLHNEWMRNCDLVNHRPLWGHAGCNVGT